MPVHRPWSISLPIAAVVFLMLALACTSAAMADQTDERLGDLFAQLKTAESHEAALPLEARIWAIWVQSGNPVVDGLMQVGSAALDAQDGEQALAAYSRVVEL